MTVSVDVTQMEDQNVNTLEGRTAIVTGASKGIGAGIARALAEAGASVVVNYAGDADGARRVVEEIVAKGGRARAVQADVTDPEQVQALFAAAREAFGPVDVLVNNAATWGFRPFQAITPELFRHEFDTNVLGPFLTMQAFAAQSEADGGAVINLSTAGITSTPAYSALYTATKSALSTATRVVAKELAGRRIRVNAIAPTASDTESSRAIGFVGSEQAVQAAAQIPLGRIGTPADIGPVAVFLASEAAAWITGETVYVSGGDR